MTFEAVLKTSRLKDLTVLQLIDPAQYIHGVQLLTGNETEFNPNIIYFGYLSTFPPSIHAAHVVNLFCCLNGALKDASTALDFLNDESYKNTNFILLPDVDDIFAVYNIVNKSIVDDLAHLDYMRDLINAFFSDQGLQHLVDTAYHVLKNPIIVIDMSDAHLAITLGENPEENSDPILANLWRDHLENQSVNLEAIEYGKQNDITQKLRHTSPLIYYHELLKHQVMASLVLVHGVEVAKVIMIEHNRSFEPTDNFYFHSLAQYIGQELSKNFFYKNNKNRIRSSFLMDLLSSTHITPKTISRRLASIDYTMQDSLYLAIFRQRNILTHNFHHIDLTFAVGTISAPILSGHLYAINNDELVVLFNFTQEQKWKLPSLETLTRFATQLDYLWGVSNEFHTLSDIHTAYTQARSAIDFGNQYFFVHEICPIRLVVFYKHISTMSLLESCAKTQPLNIFIDPSLLELKTYDDEHNTEYLYTLHVFLLCGQDRKRTADRLHIHKNTMTYRYNKLAELLNTDFMDGEELYRFSMSLRIMMHLNILDFSQFFK
jgi:sugar diacid utilization regulator